MEHKYGSFSENQMSNYKKKLHNSIHWLLVYKENDYKLLDEYFNTTLLKLNAMNELLSYPNDIVSLYETLEAARLVLNSNDFNFKTYRKLILDAHSLIDKLPECSLRG